MTYCAILYTSHRIELVYTHMSFTIQAQPGGAIRELTFIFAFNIKL